MTELKFAEISISVEDLPTRASALSDEAQGDVLGGWSWGRRRNRFRRISKRRIMAMRKAKRKSSSKKDYLKQKTIKKTKSKRSKRGSYLAKAAFHGRMASKYKSLAGRA